MFKIGWENIPNYKMTYQEHNNLMRKSKKIIIKKYKI